MYDIEFAKKLDDKTSNVSTKGKVTYTLPPKHVVSPEGVERKYDFWSQFIVIEDKTGSIGINISFGHEEDKRKNDDIVEVKGEIHKYTAVNKKTGEKEEKVVLNKGKIILSPEEIAEKEIKKGLQEAKEGKIEPIENGTKKDIEKPQVINVNNDNYKISSEQEIRRESVIIAFDYGLKENFSIHDCLDLAKTIGDYIKSGEVNVIVMNAEEKLVKKEPEKVTKVKKEKSKVKTKEEEKPEKTTKDLEKLFRAGQEIGLSTWVELIGFAVKKDIFSVGTSVEDARVKLLANDKDCYNSLIDFIDIKEDVEGLPDDEQPTSEIPF